MSAAEPVFSKRSIIALVVVLVACFAASAIGGALTRPNLDWYATLTKPSFAPPNAVFPIVWTILYAMMAGAAWLVWRSAGDEGDKKTALVWFGIQLAINVLWSFAFFWLHSPPFGFGVIMALIVAILITLILFDRVSRPAALMLIPYLLWVGFAAGLNFTLWVLNSGYDFSQPPA
jgi:tryptophan-rich sensory protein